MVAAGLQGGEGTSHSGGGGGVKNKSTDIGQEDNQQKKEKARQRWKLLCLVKTSDPKSDDILRTMSRGRWKISRMTGTTYFVP